MDFGFSVTKDFIWARNAQYTKCILLPLGYWLKEKRSAFYLYSKNIEDACSAA
jgi:hypothetical protein